VDIDRQRENFHPVHITHLKELELLRIIWNDGHQSDYPLSPILRRFCGYVICSAGSESPRRIEEKDFSVHRIDPISDSELTIAWAHGDHTGDYEISCPPSPPVRHARQKRCEADKSQMRACDFSRS
jgi:hypothetical protein